MAIGLNAAIFGIADAVLFRPLPYAAADQLYLLKLINPKTGRPLPSIPRQLFEVLEAQSSSIVGIAGRGAVFNATHSGSEYTELVGNIAVAPTFLNVLGVHPLHGRLFDSRDVLQPGRSVVLTYTAWRDRFGADPGVIGQSVMLADHVRDIVGVLEPDFIFPAEGLSYPFSASKPPQYEFLTVPTRLAVDALVRVRAGKTAAVAESEIESVVRSLKPGFEPRLYAVRPTLFPVGTLTLRILLLAAGFVLLLGCVNLSHFFLIRVQEREQEISVSLALGASRLQIVQTLFYEALIVGLCGAVAALIVALVSFGVLEQQVPIALSRGAVMGVDWRVGLFTFGLAAVSAVLFTALPAWSLATGYGAVPSVLRREAAQVRRPGGLWPVVLQVAVAMLLVSMSIFATRYFVQKLREPLGFSPDGVLAIETMPSLSQGPLTAFYNEVVHRLAGRSDVVSAGAVEALPLSGIVARNNIPMTGTDAIPLVQTLPGYFETAGIQLLRGRLFNWQDDRVLSPAIVSESAASILFPGVDPLGQRLNSERGGPFTVVGIVNDVKMTPTRPHEPLVYAVVDPTTFDGRLEFIARLRGTSREAPAEIRRLVSSLQRGMPVTTTWWSQSIDAMAEYRTPRFQSLVLVSVASLATTLAALGVWGVATSATKKRMHEVAIRLTLGEMPESLGRRLALQMGWPIGIGLMGGLIAAWLMSRLLTAYLVGFRAWEWPVLAGGAAVIALTAMLSSYIPARRAARLPAMTVLRHL